MHGGNIEVRSEGLGFGSRFIVRLPILIADESTNKKISRVNEIRSNSAVRKGGPLILIIDDNDAAAGGIGRLLEFHGCRVAYAYDGAQGLDKARVISPDAIFLDIGLPDQSGHAIAEQLRMQGFSGKLIALTGYGLNASSKNKTPKYFDQYLIKPVGLADLQRILASLN